MATHDYVIANGTGAAVRSDINGALAAIVSQNSNASAPATTYAYMSWADTSAGVMKMRNGANSAWISLYELDGTFLASDISLAAGSAAAPSLFFTGDTNTGLFSPGADTVALATAGSNRLHITSGGNVGIGSTAPGYALDVQIATSSPNTGARIYNSTVGTGNSASLSFSIANGFSSTNQHAAIQAISEGSANTLTSLAFLTSGSSNTGNASERARIDSSGRLLVGTSSARSNFFNSTVSPLIQQEGVSGSSRFASITYGTNAEDDPIFILGKHRGASVGGTTVVNSGDGLGKISFQGSDGTEFVEGAAIRAEVDGTPGANDMPGRLVFSTTADGAASPTERMRIGSDGLITAGGSATGYKALLLNSGLINTAGGLLSLRTVANSSGGYYQVFRNADDTIIGAITQSTASTISYSSFSDYRLKENVIPVPDGINRFKKLKPSRFNFIADPDTTVDGFLAHEAQAVVPECVTGEKDAVDEEGNPVYQGIDQSKLVPLLTAALQEAIAKIEALETRLSALEAA